MPTGKNQGKAIQMISYSVEEKAITCASKTHHL